jgi:copper chaperone CopZ
MLDREEAAIVRQSIARLPPKLRAACATAEFAIAGMECGRCAASLARVLEALPGVASARVDFDKRIALVRYNATQMTTDEIESAIEESGVFEAKLVSQIQQREIE